MPQYLDAPARSQLDAARIGVLLVNLGTPADPTPRGVRRFLAEMLADPRLVELPRLLWLPILHGIVLRVRPRRSARAYQRIWTPEGSPQLVIGQRVATALERLLSARLTELAGVRLAMSYGEPTIASQLAALRDAGAERLFVLPLYPQYSSATTASVFDRVTSELARWRAVPDLHFSRGYHDAPAYIAALRHAVLEHWQRHGRGEKLLMSFHGMPRRTFERGDPYYHQCQATARLLAQALDLKPDDWSLSFQSRFGYQEWLRPYSLEVIQDLARQGSKRLDVICPGFAVDCLESLDEIAIEAAREFRHLGGERLEYIAALNDRAEHVEFLAQLIAQHCNAWEQPVAASGGAERVRVLRETG